MTPERRSAYAVTTSTESGGFRGTGTRTARRVSRARSGGFWLRQRHVEVTIGSGWRNLGGFPLLRGVPGPSIRKRPQTFRSPAAAWAWANGFLSAGVRIAETSVSAKPEWQIPQGHLLHIGWHSDQPLAPLEIPVPDSGRTTEERLHDDANWLTCGSQLDHHYDLLTVMQIAQLWSSDGEADFRVAASYPAGFQRPHSHDGAPMSFEEVTP